MTRSGQEKGAHGQGEGLPSQVRCRALIQSHHLEGRGQGNGEFTVRLNSHCEFRARLGAVYQDEAVPLLNSKGQNTRSRERQPVRIPKDAPASVLQVSLLLAFLYQPEA